jgi:dUTP pyrophosphatase
MDTLRVKRVHTDASLPSRGSAHAAGYDLSCIQDFEIHPQKRELVQTGIAIQMPPGVYGRVAPRSGLTVRHGVHIGAGVIDSDYTGELKVAMFNLGDTSVSFKRGDRVAQLILERHEIADVQEVNEFETSDRGEGGFGSTGL